MSMMKSKFMRSVWPVLLVSIGALVVAYIFVDTREIREQLDRVAAARARMDIGQISLAMNLYRMRHGAYPASTERLEVERILLSVPVDPWGEPYIYRVPGRSEAFEVYTLGADGKEGGSGKDADIGSWTLKLPTF